MIVIAVAVLALMVPVSVVVMNLKADLVLALLLPQHV
jgi:hypothetical protein